MSKPFFGHWHRRVFTVEKDASDPGAAEYHFPIENIRNLAQRIGIAFAAGVCNHAKTPAVMIAIRT